jgi:aspartate racemase
MPRVAPPGGAVDWPEAEGVLGVVGVAPWATIEFCRVLYQAVAATKDWHFPRVVLDINTKIPSRGRHLQLGETNPSSAIAWTIAELAGMGATVAVVVCNTAHILYEQWARNAPIPVLNIIEATVGCAVESGSERVAPLVAASLARYDLYGERAEGAGLSCHRLEAQDQNLVNEVISGIKVSGRVATQDETALHEMLGRLRSLGVDTIIGGCTELSVVERHCASWGLKFVDSNVALARAALGRLGLPDGMIRRGGAE